MQSGDVIAGRFVLEEPIGQGGMGIVFRARDQDGTAVALKVLKRSEPSAVERFAREAELLAALAHPAIVRYVAHGTSPIGTPFLAMDWLDGEDLAQRLKRGPLPIDEALALAVRVADALGAAHAQGIIHRDIKPHNLFLPGRRLDQVTIIDFGIARAGGELSAMTATGALLGTAGYLAPEQATRGARGLDARADVFSLGCVLYECLTGQLPFGGENALAVLSKILLAEAPRVREQRAEVPAALEQLIIEALAKDPAARPRDGAALASRLRAVREGGAGASEGSAVERHVLSGAERRLLCVLLLGSDAARRGSDDGAARSERERATITREVVRFGGHLDALLDGSSLVTFAGLEVATDLAAQAARCALALRASFPEVPIALATGRGEAGHAYPVGEAIDRAVLLLRDPLAVPDPDTGHRDVERRPGIWVDEVTAGLLDQRFEVGGDASGLELQRERALWEVRTFLGRVLPCVGRERELAGLEAIASECVADEAAAAVLVTAPPGVGKTRLRRELIERLARRVPPFEVFVASAEPLRAGSALALIGDALRDAAGIRGGETSSLRHKKLRARLSRHLAGAELETASLFLGELAGTELPDETHPILQAARRDPQVMGAQLQRAFEAFLRAELRAGPVLIAIEDLHWSDPATVRLLDAALRTFADRPLMVLALARPEVRATFPELWSSCGVIEIGLSPLPKKSIARFIANALGDDFDPGRAQQIGERSQGNAFYLEELCRAAAEGRDERLPSTVVAMAGARLEAFSVEDRKLLRAASVFGERFWLGGLLALGEGDRRALRERLRALVEREVIGRSAEAAVRDEEEYVFRHALMREAAYAALTDDDRRVAHRLAGAWLAEGRERDPLVLAEHFERGGVAERAIAEYIRAARHALATSLVHAPEPILALVRRALALGAQGQARGELLALQIEANVWSGRMEVISEWGWDALELIPRASASWYRTAGWLLSATGVTQEGDPRSARLLEELINEFPNREVFQAQLFTWGMLQFHMMLTGHYAEVRQLQRRIQEAERLVLEDATVGARVRHDPVVLGGFALSKAFAAYQMDADPWAMWQLLHQALERFREAQEPNLNRNVELHVAVAALMLGDYEAAEAKLRALGTEGGEGPLVKSFLAMIYLWRQRHAEARALVEAILPAMIASQSAVDIAVNRALLAQVALGQGDLARADEQVSLALEFRGAGFRSLALSVLTELRLAQGRAHEALAATLEREQLLAEAGIVDIIGLVKLSTYISARDAAGVPADERLGELRALILDRASRIDEPRYRQSFLAAPDNALVLRLAEERLGPP